MAEQIKRVSELPTTTSTDGLYTLGVDAKNEGVKIPLGDLLGKINDTKKNKDFVMTMTYDKITTDEGAEFDLIDTEWDALADIVSHGECDIVLRDGIRNAYQLDHVFLSDGMPFGYKILPNNQTLNIATVIDSASSTLKLVWKFNDGAVTYDELGEKPSINGVELIDNKTSKDLKLQGALRTSADLALSSDDVLSLTDMAKKRLFIDLWNECAVDFGRYNEETGYFELNGITDLTWDDAVFIYTISARKDAVFFANVGYGYGANTRPLKGRFRTNLPINYGEYAFNTGDGAAKKISTYLCSELEVLNVFPKMPFGRTDFYIRSQCSGLDLYYNNKLRKVMGKIRLVKVNAIYYGYNFPYLEEINLYNITNDYKYFYKTPKLNYTSVKTMIEQRGGTNAITIWYHADVYNKILGTAADAAYQGSGGTKEEWMALADLAASKNITLATE